MNKMELMIIADKDFKKYLDEYEIKYEKLSQSNYVDGACFCLSQVDILNLLLNSSIAFVISVFSPFITDAIRKYINKTKKDVNITLIDKTFNITYNNIDTQINLVIQEFNRSEKMQPYDLTPNPTDRILCVKVGKIKRESLYEMTRKYWAVKIERASKATHVFAVVNGIVIAVYIPHEWSNSKDPGHEGRCEFVGKEDKHSIYIGKSVKSYYGNSTNPVRYINM